MKKFKELLTVALAVLLVVGTFTGCAGNNLKEKNGPVSAVIGVANTVNNASIDVDSVLGTKLEEILSEDGSSISYYEIDGECLVIQSVNIRLAVQRAIRNQNLKQIFLR